METSIYIAKLMGPTMVVMAAALLKDQDGVKAMAREFIGNRSLVFVAGVFTLIGGLAVTIHHNIWVVDWPLLITIVGWAMVVGGIVRIALPELVKSWGEKMLQPEHGLTIVGVVWLLIGGFLSFVGYF
ncbi:MAG: hypothetical protein ABJH63_18705 [Rhizobiaceae bacterium]